MQTVYVIYDPRCEKVLCVHDEEGMECDACKSTIHLEECERIVVRKTRDKNLEELFETTDAVELFQPDLLEVESTVTPISCYLGSDGAIAITQISGGTVPYAQVVWDDPNSQVGSAATSLARGTYTATITDANGCEV